MDFFMCAAAGTRCCGLLGWRWGFQACIDWGVLAPAGLVLSVSCGRLPTGVRLAGGGRSCLLAVVLGASDLQSIPVGTVLL